jgi:predicted helicase
MSAIPLRQHQTRIWTFSRPAQVRLGMIAAIIGLTTRASRDGMSQLLVNQYLGELDRLRRVSGASRESVVREAFKDLLKAWGRMHELQFVAEHEFITPTKERRYIDGALLHELRVPFGYWEAKDTSDDLDEEIAKKFRRGYPQTNIIFEDSTKAILIQGGQEVMRCDVDDPALRRLLELFFAYQRPEIADFRKAITQFKQDLPAVLKALRERIEEAYTTNSIFADAARQFLLHAQKSINPSVTDADVREMLIQHILTEDIFVRVFGNDDFHRDNNVAKALYELERKFFRGDIKQRTLRALEPYYAAIRSTAALIQSHSEKQGFLKAIYENFYKVYNPKAADRLGVVYTPNEIVRFMVQSADWLCEKHFGKNLIDRNVEILDPATGTGTFIVELLEHFRGRPAKMKYKFLNELHANEVAILPYYVANLNIEATYAAIMGEYAEFPNLCLVDTLDNTDALSTHVGQHFGDLLGGISTENVERIRRQNSRKISVIIGNPPYNANQRNENDNNKNRKYPEIDRRIKATYIKESTAQKAKNYDMYSRFFRWAADRIDQDGIVAFVTNRGFVDKRNFDGFRKLAARDFSDIYVVDLGGDVRDNPKLSGTMHNVFGIQIGVAISFLVKRRTATGSHIHYGRRPEFETREDKLAFLHNAVLAKAAPELLSPDVYSNWLDIPTSDSSELLPLVTKATKGAKSRGDDAAIFRLFSLGIATNRDDWVYDKDQATLQKKVAFFINFYEAERKRWKAEGRPANITDWVRRDIKWTSELEALLRADKPLKYNSDRLRRASYRPFGTEWAYYDTSMTHRPYQNDKIFPIVGKWANSSLIFTGPSA